MNAGLIARWNAAVSADDEVIVLGDVVMGKAEDSLRLVRQLSGHKRLIAGNHDRCWRGRKSAYVNRWSPLYEDAGFDILSHGEAVDLRLGGLPVRASHFPYHADERHADQFEGHYPTDDGGWLIHGHVHEDWLVCGRQVNVGVDVNDYAPVSDARLIEIIQR